MMVVDFICLLWLRTYMDDDKAELIKQLYTCAGTVMEDASIIALELGGPRSAFAQEETDRLERAAQSITHLLQAARSLQS